MSRTSKAIKVICVYINQYLLVQGLNLDNAIIIYEVDKIQDTDLQFM